MSLTTSLSGLLQVSWQGDPARCAQAGVCGVVGTVDANANAGGTETSSGTVPAGEPPIEAISNVPLPSPGIVRVITGGDAPGACLDELTSDGGGGFALIPVRGGLRISDAPPPAFRSFSQPGLLGAGRCAGPLPGDLAGLIPTRFVSNARLARGLTVPLTADRTFAAGPFSGTLLSTLRLHIRRSTGTTSIPVPAPPVARGHRVIEVADVTRAFTIGSSTGGLQAAFAGAPPPLCTPLDACGVTGASTLSALTGTVELAARPSLPASAGSSAEAALRLLAAGALPVQLFAGSDVSATVTEVADRPGAATCRDSAGYPFSFEGNSGPAGGGGTGTGATEAIIVPPGGPIGGGDDLLRTRCPGPSENDLLPESFDDGGGSPGLFASASVPVAALLAGGPVVLTFTSIASRLDGAYGLSERGPLTVTLVPRGPVRVVVHREVTQ